MATYPAQLKTFQNKSNTVDIIDASHPNTLQDEVAAVQSTIGTLPFQSTTPSSGGTFVAVATTFDTVKARLANIETGIVADTHSQYIRKISDSGNEIIPANAGVKGLVIKAFANQTANLQEWQSVVAVASAVAAGGGVTYTANNTFKIGQRVTITGASPGSFNLSNQIITDATSTFFTITNNGPSGSATGGTATSAVTVIDSTGSLVGVQSTNILTTKGDIAVATSAGVTIRLAAGANGTYLVADSSTASGLRWNTISPITENSSSNLANKTLTAPKINLGVATRSSTSFLLALDDNGQLLNLTGTSTIAVRVPLFSAVPFPVGSQIHLVASTDSTVNVIGEDPAVLLAFTPGNKLRTRNSTATLINLGENSWLLVGDLRLA